MTAKWDDMAVVGWIARAHGIRGQVIVNPETDFPEGRFRPGAELFLNRAGVVEPLTVTSRLVIPAAAISFAAVRASSRLRD